MPHMLGLAWTGAELSNKQLGKLPGRSAVTALAGARKFSQVLEQTETHSWEGVYSVQYCVQLHRHSWQTWTYVIECIQYNFKKFLKGEGIGYI